MKSRTRAKIAAVIAVPIAIGGWYTANHKGAVRSWLAHHGFGSGPKIEVDHEPGIGLSDVPEWLDPGAGQNGTAFVVIDSGRPGFTEEEISEAEEIASRGEASGGLASYKEYLPLDSLGRPQQATAILSAAGMPTEERGSIGMIRPAGWQIAKYDFIDGKYLYNRCHLVGYQLAGDNADEKILMTGTRYLNIHGMLPNENKVASYMRNERGIHVLYRVTPVYKGSELLARGVQIEAMSLEDRGAGLSLNVYCYNEQPGVVIDHATGDNREAS